MATATPYVNINTETNLRDDKILFFKIALSIIVLLIGWASVIILWGCNHMSDYSSHSYVFAICGFCLGVVGCGISHFFKLGNIKQAIACNLLACFMFIVLHYAKVKDSSVYWTHGSIMLAGVIHVFLKSLHPFLKLVCSVPRMILRGSM